MAASKLALGVVIGGAVSASVGSAFRDIEGRIKRLDAQGAKARALQTTIGETLKLQQEWRRAHLDGAATAEEMRRKLERNLGELTRQGVAVRNLAKEYKALGREANASELRATGATQIQEGKEGFKANLGRATALAAAAAIPTKVSGDYQASIRQMAMWAHIAGTEEEAALANRITAVAAEKGMGQQKLATAVAGLIEKGIDWEESVDYAPLVADLIDGQGMEAATVATLFHAFKEAGVKQQDMAGMIGQVAAAGDIGAFGPKEMARYLPSLLGTIRRLGMEGPEAVQFLGASLQSQYNQTQDAAAAATNMDNLLNAVISSTSQERFASEGYDLAGSLMAAVRSGKAANPVDAFIALSEKLLAETDPERAAEVAALKAKIRESKDGSAEEEQAMVALLEAAGLATIVGDKSASAGLLTQIKYGDKIRQDIASIQATDGQTKVMQDAARAREASNARWASAAAGTEAAMTRIGDAIRPVTDLAADGLAKLTYGIADLAGRFPNAVSGALLLGGAVTAAGTLFSAYKYGKGMLNVARGVLKSDPNAVQRVFVTNQAAGGSAGVEGSEVGRAGRRGPGVGTVAKSAAVFAVVDAGLKAVDTYQNATTDREKAEGYGDAAGGLAGTLAGAAAGAALGSVVPIVGTAVGGIIGGILGGMGGSSLGAAVGRWFTPEEQPEVVPSAAAQELERLASPAAQLGNVAPSVQQSIEFAPQISLVVPDGVTNPRELVGELMPHLEQAMRDLAAEQQRSRMYDQPHV